MKACTRCRQPGHYASTCDRAGLTWSAHMLATGRCRCCGELRTNSAVYCETCRVHVNSVRNALRARRKAEAGLDPLKRAPLRCSTCGRTEHNSRTCAQSREEM